MADQLETSPYRDPEAELQAIREEIGIRLDHGENLQARLLWVAYIFRFVEIRQEPLSQFNPDQFREQLAKQIIDSANDIDITSAFNGLSTLTKEILNAKADNIPLRDTLIRVVVEADPVTMFNGQFIQEVTDLQINGAGISFEFKRTYKNQAAYSGPLGANWDHAYNLRLRVVGDILFLSNGGLRDDIYTRHPQFGQAGFNYWVPPDSQHGIIQETPPSFCLRFPNGTRHFYEVDPTEPTRHRIERIEDKHGNYLQFRYRDPIDGQLGQIEINHPNRLVRFDYDEQMRIVAVGDYTGRQWHYEYDDFGDLVGVTAPATPEYPTGLTTYYEYSSAQFSGPLQHNLTRIFDPEGQMYLENEYGIAENLLSFNRVTMQRQGGGFSFLEYANVVQEFDFNYGDTERPAYQTSMIDRNGHQIVEAYNRFGNLILREEQTLQDGIIKTLSSRFRYNADGSLIGELTPEGSVTQYLYGRDYYIRRHMITGDVAAHDQLTDVERLAFANILAVVKRGKQYALSSMNLARDIWGDIFPDIFVSDSQDIVTKFTFEPNYQQIRTVSDPRFTRSANPVEPLEHPRYQETLTIFEYSQPTGSDFPSPAGRPQMNTQNLYLRRNIYPDTHLPDGGQQTSIQQELLRYDDRGRLLSSRDPVGNLTELTYFKASDGVKEGFLKSQTLDPNNLAIRSEYEVNLVGIVTAIIHPKAQSAASGQFRTEQQLNALDQTTKTVSPLPFALETRSFYDRNRQLIRIERDLEDENGIPILGGSEVKTFQYDEQFNLLTESIGGHNLDSHLITRHRYDACDQRIRTYSPKGNQIWFTFDERGLATSVTRGACSPDISTRRTKYSEDGLVRETIDGLGRPTKYEYDVFHRRLATIDPLRHVERLDYDKAGNVTSSRFFELQVDGSYNLLSRSEHIYDELNRKIIERHNVFETPLVANNLALDYLDSPGPGNVIETQYFYDRKGRTSKVINPKGQVNVTEYDALDRVSKVTDAMGNYTLSSYDAHNLLVRRDLHELFKNPTTGQLVREDVFFTLYDYDELDRLRATTDSLGNKIQYFYDSRDNIVRQIDPLGNIRRFEHDVFNRKTAEIVDRTINGLGGGTALSPVITRYEYDPNGNLVATIDANGNRTEREYDQIDRQILLRYPDLTTQLYNYDAAHNMIFHLDNNGLARTYQPDSLDRVLRMDVDNSSLTPGIGVAGATFEVHGYDGAGRIIHEENDFVSSNRKFDSLGRCYAEIHQFHINTPGINLVKDYAIQREFDDLGNITNLTYPSGRKIRYFLDELNRIEKIENLTKGIGYPGSNAFPDNYTVLTHQYRGLRPSGTLNGNGSSTSFAYDFGGRLIEIAHQARNGGVLLTIQQLYDAAGNMRMKNEIQSGGSVGEAHKYDSLYWLTKIEENVAIPVYDARQFEPAGVATTPAVLTGQSQIDAAIGNLNNDPANFTFRYDSTGNRLEDRSSGHTPLTYTSNNLNQYLSAGAQSFIYDLNGNLMNDGKRKYVYDFRNQLVQVNDLTNGRVLAQFLYDSQARRIASVQNDQITHFVFNNQNIIEEYQGTSVWAQYVHEYDLDSIRQIVAQSDEHWHHQDLTSVRILSNASGTSAGSYRYSVFGEIYSNVPVYNPYTYQCRLFDGPIGSYDFRLRQYFPIMGRFLQRDAVDGQNLYEFVGNNPTTGVDPLGMDRLPKHKLMSDPSHCMENPGSNSCADMYVSYQGWSQKLNYENERRNALAMALISKTTGNPAFAFGAFAAYYVRGAGLEEQMAFGDLFESAFGMLPILTKVLQVRKEQKNISTAKIPDATITRFNVPRTPTTKASPEGQKIYWGHWNDYPKETVQGQELARVGDRLYSREAVDRMQPSGNRYREKAGNGSHPQIAQTGGNYQSAREGAAYGRSVAPQYVEYVIRGSLGIIQPNGKISHKLGDLEVILSPDGQRVVTIINK